MKVSRVVVKLSGLAVQHFDAAVYQLLENDKLTIVRRLTCMREGDHPLVLDIVAGSRSNLPLLIMEAIAAVNQLYPKSASILEWIYE